MAKCKTGLYRVRQVLAAREIDCGIPGYIDPNGKAVEVQVSPTFNENINMIENNVARKTLTRTPNIPGLRSSNLAFTAWAKGSGTPAIEPAFGIYLEGCGFTPIALDLLTISAGSGDFEVGETVTGAPSGATGIVRVKPKKGYNGELYVEPVTGAFAAADTITGGTSGTTATADAQTTAGFEYRPVSENFQNLTIRSEEDSVICKEGNGMLGTFTLTGDNSNPAAFEFTFDGRIGGYYRVSTDTPTIEPIAVNETLSWAGGTGTVVAAYNKTGGDPYLIYTLDSGVAIADTNAVTAAGGASFNATSKSFDAVDTCAISDGVSFDPGQPPIIQCAEFSANGFNPILQQFVLDMQNEVVVREDLNSCTGNQPATITGRNPQLTFNPEVFDVADWNVYDSWKNGELVTGFDLWIGKQAGNRLFIQMDKIQIQQIADGDRDGTAIFDITATVTSETDDGEISIYFL